MASAGGSSAGAGSGAWGLAVGMGAFVVYVVTAAPTPYLLDSAQLAAAAYGLGIAHPPGEALSLLWGKLFALLPLGSVAFRVGVSQAVAGAIAAWLAFVLARGLIDRADPAGGVQPVVRNLLAATAALGFALAPGVVLSANRPEVYALAMALALGALLAAGSTDPRGCLLGAVLVGLGVANHPLVAGMAGLGAVAAALPLLRAGEAAPRGRLAAYAVGAFLAGTAVLAYLPLRATAVYAAAQEAAADIILWGDARSLGGFWWIVSGRTFIAKSNVVHTGSEPEVLPFAIAEEIGLPLLLLAVAGVLYVVRTPAARRSGLPLLAALAGSAVAAVAAGFDPHNPDIRGYLGVALAATAALGAVGLTAFAGAIRRTWVGGAAALALALGTAAHVLPIPRWVDLYRAEAADRIGRDILAQAPPRAVLFTSHFETGFLLAYHRFVEGLRPDAVWVHLGFVRGPGYASRVAASHPDLRPALEAHRTAALLPADLRALARPARVEPDQHLDARLRADLSPAGHLWQVAPAGAPARRAGLTPLPRDLLPEAARDRQVRGFLGWRAYGDGLLACSLGLTDVAAQRLGELQTLLPHDQRARSLLTACPTSRR